jgi:hypothetical protein
VNKCVRLLKLRMEGIVFNHLIYQSWVCKSICSSQSHTRDIPCVRQHEPVFNQCTIYISAYHQHVESFECELSVDDGTSVRGETGIPFPKLEKDWLVSACKRRSELSRG